MSRAMITRMTGADVESPWHCAVCGSADGEERFRLPTDGTEGGVNGEAFRPSADRFGSTTGRVLRCRRCGHASVAQPPEKVAVADAYADAVDEVSLREQEGQVATADRALEEIEKLGPVAAVCDLGCWTGSFLLAAQKRGWEAVGVEPSVWASSEARGRDLDVRTTALETHGLEPGRFRLVVFADVLEHLVDPGAAVDIAHELLAPGGLLYVTVPDAGSRLARMMGRRWWSVLPMHLQYFTRSSMRRLLEDHGFAVRSIRTHAKKFSARYYAERLGGYSPAVERAAVGVLRKAGRADRLIAPDFRDRMAVIAERRSTP